MLMLIVVIVVVVNAIAKLKNLKAIHNYGTLE